MDLIKIMRPLRERFNRRIKFFDFVKLILQPPSPPRQVTSSSGLNSSALRKIYAFFFKTPVLSGNDTL